MKGTDFTQNSTVREIVHNVKQDMAGRHVSDIIDDHEHQYVDIVMEGGGVLGIALLGYTYVLEEVGIRFLDIGGTSAGSIGALLLAAADTKDKPKSERIAVALANQDLSLFMDCEPAARRFLQAALKKAGFAVSATDQKSRTRRFLQPLLDKAGWGKLGFHYLQARRGFVENLGFNPGDAFLKWLKTTLNGYGVETTSDLMERMGHRPEGLKRREGEEVSEDLSKARLAMIAAEVLTETKVEFPKMADLFWDDYEELNPALYVRASMSVPYFFHPFRVKDIPQGPEAEKKWDEKASYRGSLPEKAMFIDGGIMSNFPVDVFHVRGSMPACPTFGVKLGNRERETQDVDKPHELGFAMFNAARHCLDYDFIHRNPDYKHLLGYIDTGNHGWLDFELTDEAKVDLFKRGAKAADQFLRGFDWPEYKDIRADLLQTYKQTSIP